MREPLKDRIRLEHIQDAINNINKYLDGKTFQQLSDDSMLFYAVVKNIEIYCCPLKTRNKFFVVATS